jgi:hypothetical protein
MKINKVDRIILFYPFILYSLVVFYFLNNLYRGTPPKWGPNEIQISSVLAFVIFGNFAHNFMSYWQVFRLQEFKNWRQEYTFYKLSILQIIALVFIFFICLIYFVLPSGFNTFSMVFGKDQLTNIIVFFFFAINTHHNLSQMKGVGFSHSFHYLQNVSAELNETLNRKEKLFYQFLMIDWFFYFGWFIFSKRENFYTVTILRTIILCIAYALLMRIYLRLPKTEAQIKIIYSVRHFYRFFFSLHIVFTFIAYAMHGADAILTYWKSLEKTKSTNKNALKLEFIFLFLLLTIFYVFHYQIYRSIKFAYLETILVAIFLTHYVVEGFLYRFRNPITKKYIVPLL